MQELNDEDDTEDEERCPKMGEASGHRPDNDDEVVDNDQQIHFTKGMLREMMTDIVGSVLDQASPHKSSAGSKLPSKRSKKALGDKKVLDKKWQRTNFCVSNNICAINLSKQLRIK